MGDFASILDNSEIESIAGLGIKNIMKVQSMIIDEIGRTSANRGLDSRFFSFSSDIYETSANLLTATKARTDCAELMGDLIHSNTLFDGLYYHAKNICFLGDHIGFSIRIYTVGNIHNLT